MDIIKKMLLLGHEVSLSLALPRESGYIPFSLASPSPDCREKKPQQIGFAVGFANVSLGRKPS